MKEKIIKAVKLIEKIKECREFEGLARKIQIHCTDDIDSITKQILNVMQIIKESRCAECEHVKMINSLIDWKDKYESADFFNELKSIMMFKKDMNIEEVLKL